MIGVYDFVTTVLKILMRGGNKNIEKRVTIFMDDPLKAKKKFNRKTMLCFLHNSSQLGNRKILEVTNTQFSLSLLCLFSFDVISSREVQILACLTTIFLSFISNFFVSRQLFWITWILDEEIGLKFFTTRTPSN